MSERDTPCPRCLHRAHEPGQCNTGSTYGCGECGPLYDVCPTCEGEGRVPEPAPATDGEREPEYSIMNGWLAVPADGCTCYGGGPYGHEPGCGYEPVANIEKALLAAGYGLRQVPDEAHDAQVASEAWDACADAANELVGYALMGKRGD